LDMVCYRRHGHNEADEPAATQPRMYHIIRNRPTTRALYAEKLSNEKIVTAEQIETMVQAYRDALDKGIKVARPVIGGITNGNAVDWRPYLGQDWTAPCQTAIPVAKVDTLATKLANLPKDFVLQPQVAKLMKDRERMHRQEIAIDWGFAETMAYASLLDEGHHVRLCGQDSCRGTFAHRHAVLHDYETGATYTPLEHISEKQASIAIIDSVLSEEAVLGFEFGYATTDPKAMVIWEAQFGDFANGAQVVVDQFISSAYSKWGRLCGLIMLLPHGFEGQGPEHSSARLERYLQLCAEHNMQVCVPSTPAQNFHMLRRQMLRPFRAPLIVMSPKSLLRHPLAVSDLRDLSEGHFHPAIPEIDDIDVKAVQRVVMCSGKVYYDLLQQRRKVQKNDVAIIRIEQLYPFPENEVQEILAQFTNAKELVWCQEEPMNQGAWYPTRHRFEACVRDGQRLTFAGRDLSASPAVGQMALHLQQQAELVHQALNISL
jgi:2-oxoglutarate dehydrogenase E1 component